MKHTKPFWVLIVLLLFTFTGLLNTGVYAKGRFNRDDFKKFVRGEMKKYNVPGVSVLIINDGKVIFSHGFGYRDFERKLKVDSKTVFPVASCTKTFNSTCVGLLVDEKRMEWDRPLRYYYPELMMYDRYATERVTLRDALCHRSGLPRHDRVWLYAGLSRNELMKRLRYLQPSHGFREVFQYNNIVYTAAGVAVEKVSGMKWEDFVRTKIFKPLGMNSSSLSIDELKKTKNHSLGYKVDSKSPKTGVLAMPYHPVNTTGPSSCINSNVEDMGRWLMLHINRGVVGGKRLISKKTLDEIHTPQVTIPPTGEFEPYTCNETPVLCYALGWVVQPYNGHMMLNHSGGIDGFTSMISFMPKEKIGVVVLTNRHRSMLPYTITFNIFDRLLGYRQIDRGERFARAIKKILKNMSGGKKAVVRKNAPHTHPLKDYAGTYTNPAYGAIVVTMKDKVLYAKFRNTTAQLKHLHYDVFRGVFKMPGEDVRLELAFGMNRHGDVSDVAIPMQPGIDMIVFKR